MKKLLIDVDVNRQTDSYSSKKKGSQILGTLYFWLPEERKESSWAHAPALQP